MNTLILSDTGQVVLGILGGLFVAVVLAFAIALWSLWKSMN
jgi:hypothetical protein